MKNNVCRLSVYLSVCLSVSVGQVIIHLPPDSDIADSVQEGAATILAVNRLHQTNNQHTPHKPITLDKTLGLPTTMIPYLKKSFVWQLYE